MTALIGVIERVSSLAVVATGCGGGLAHLLLAVGLEVDLVHGGSRVAQRLRDGRVRVAGGRIPAWQRIGQK